MSELTDELHNEGWNTCDDCNELIWSNDLAWINSEGFEPLEDEFIPMEVHQKFEALCSSCYIANIKVGDTHHSK